MLVLSRRVNDEIMIGETIRVVVLKVAGGRVKLGLTAPNDVSICREEISRTRCEAAPHRPAHAPQRRCCHPTNRLTRICTVPWNRCS